MPRFARNKNRILVISDLHLTAGRNPATGTWSPTEDFFWDEDLSDFLSHYGERGGWTLVVNGDLFDFLQVLDRPSAEECRAYGIPPGDRSRRYGLQCSEAAAVFQMDRIANGHPLAFGALAGFLARGNRVVLLKGNHDVQLFWPAVQERLRDRLEGAGPSGKGAAIRANLEIFPWCYVIPGLLYCEHGNQYEPATAYAHFLHPVLPAKSPWSTPLIELDLGSLVVRYISNRLEILDPRSDNYRPLSAYLTLVLRRHPMIFLSTIRDALRYIRESAEKAMRTRWRSRGRFRARFRERFRARFRAPDRGAGEHPITALNRGMIASEAARFSGADPEKGNPLYDAIIACAARRAEPTLNGGVNRVIREQARPILIFLAWCLPLYLLTYIPEFSGILRSLLPGTEFLFLLRLPQALLAFLLIAAAVELKNLLDRRRRRHAASDDPVRRLRAAAAAAARTLEVRYVAFGHTHVEEEVHLDSGHTYFNTGTWIGIATESPSLHRGMVQFTYLKIEGGEAELLRWQPRGAVPRRAVILNFDPIRRS